MALFDEGMVHQPAPRPPMRRSAKIGGAALAIALVVLAALSFLPTGYVIQEAGPVYNTLGTVTAQDGQQVPLISIEGAETFPSEGTLSLTTIQVIGNRERTPSWIELLGAWFTPSRAVYPLDRYFPNDTTSEERNEQNAGLMIDSQQDATAAALTHLGYDVGSRVRVHSLPDNSPAQGILDEGDVIIEANGAPLTVIDDLREAIQVGAGDPVVLKILRDEQEQTVTVTPTLNEATDTWMVGVSIIHDYDFPIQVTIQLNNVGGSSAGQMFALGIIDTLTPGELNGGRNIAGTGEITADGSIGRIGGIRQKLFGARDAGAEFFLAPVSNCDEVVGNVPDGLQVFAVENLDDSLDILQAIRDDGDLAALPTCE